MAGEDTNNFSVWGFIKGFGKLLIGLLLLLQGIVGLIFLLFFVGMVVGISNGIGGGKGAIKQTIEAGSALLLDPKGVLVEQAEMQDPFEAIFENAYGIDDESQVEERDLARAIRKAKDDDRIKGIVLDFSELYIPSSSASKIHELASEIEAFRQSGKKVVAVGDFYGQEQYLVAAHADEILLHDYGNVVLYGYGAYNAYIKSFLDKLKVTTHVFRVGTFKSAVEPFIRDDMSPEAEAANLAYLNVLWDEYAHSAEEARGLPQGAIKRFADDLPALMAAAGGDFAKAAKDYGLVDQLMGTTKQRGYLVGMFGEDKDDETFKHVAFRQYLAAVGETDDDDSDPNVAIVTAAGSIVDGEAAPGTAAGGETIAAHLKTALDDDKVKAVVLRVDSPGGSAFASEHIRDGVLALKAAGKPVVVSMGSLAASGGYWISAPADEIFAAPTTITGSIGIFGLFATFENTAGELGIHTDGVGTSKLAPILATGLGPLPPEAADIFQRATEDGYERFLTVVAEGRSLDRNYVDSIGQGHVWIGTRARELKLVDKIGGLDDAVASAAARANLEKYDVVDIVEKITPFERIFGETTTAALKLAGLDADKSEQRRNALRRLLKQADATLKFFDGFNDPNGVYARCLTCGAN